MTVNNFLPSRVKNLQKLIGSRKIDCLLVSSPSNISYLTGVNEIAQTEREVFLVISKKEAVAFVSPLKLESFIDLASFEVIALEKKETFSEKLIGKFKESLRKTRIGFESEDIRVAELRRLRRKTGFKFVAEDGLVEKLRLIKDEFEIESLRKAGQITRKTWQELKKSLRVGMTEREGMKLILDLLHKFGADGVPNGFFPIVASGPNSAIPHHNSGSRKIGTNEVVLIDFGCIVNGYCSDMTRVMMIGNRSKEYERIEALVKRAYGVAVDLVKEGTDTRLIDEMVGEILGSAGYSEKMPHSTGHGVGLDIHENPAVSSKSRRPWRLASGMVITIEPGIYLPGKFGIRYENTLLVTKDGYEILTD